MQRKANILTVLILAGVVLGVLIGHFILWDPGLMLLDPAERSERIQQNTGWWHAAGDFILMRPLKLIAMPLIFTSVLIGVTGVGDPKRLGVLGGATLVFYLATMIFAVTLGVTLGATLKPGDGVSEDLRAAAATVGEQHLGQRGLDDPGQQDLGSAWRQILELMIPDNFVGAIVNEHFLSIITVTIVMGIGLLIAGPRGRPFIAVVESLHEALMILVRALLWIMPLGVMFLVAWSVGSMGLANLAGALGKYAGIVALGLGIHMFVTLPLVLWLVGRVNPYKYMWQMRPALFTAFGTASSMATLPVTIESATNLGGCSKRSAGIVLPLGATVNMDGTALYQGIAVIFMFQAFGYDLHFAQYLAIVLTATLAAVGAAGIPAGGLVTTIIIISAVNSTLAAGDPTIPALPLAAAIGLILPVDRILDMCRTSVNIWGDATGARIITRLAPDDVEEKEKAFS
ncbi:MAG: dicarboxylate/amino acid:cation symporter [Phycisphaeraceae bacterium]|nr:MAG: dicarboxylate/amino acid:cation symporter [Phycisphaeraceae bacterium]